MSNRAIAAQIFKVLPERVWRTYSGGRELENWLGLSDPCDGDYPELWIASTVTVRNTESKSKVDEGLGRIKLNSGKMISLNRLIAGDPSAFLGARHYLKFGANPGILVKMIDSLNRLTIQVHPDKDFAARIFGSNYGKTEAWYILEGRLDTVEEPYVLLGFKPGVTRHHWQLLFETQDIPGMIDCLHKIPVKPGEVYLIEGGVPHAIGSGCFLMEIQEPTDYTMRVERKTPEGKGIPDFLCHQGTGFTKMLDCFHYETYSLADTLNKWRIVPQECTHTEEGMETVLLGSKQTKLFGLRRLDVHHRLDTGPEESFTIVIVLSGLGKAKFNGGMLAIKTADLLFVPATVGPIVWLAEQGSDLQLLRCFPPA